MNTEEITAANVSFRAVAAHIEKNNPNIRFLIQNKPGADEILGLNDFFTKPADGTNLLVASYAIMATSEIFFPEAMKHNVMDLSLVTTIAKSPLFAAQRPFNRICKKNNAT